MGFRIYSSWASAPLHSHILSLFPFKTVLLIKLDSSSPLKMLHLGSSCILCLECPFYIALHSLPLCQSYCVLQGLTQTPTYLLKHLPLLFLCSCSNWKHCLRQVLHPSLSPGLSQLCFYICVPNWSECSLTAGTMTNFYMFPASR